MGIKGIWTPDLMVSKILSNQLHLDHLNKWLVDNDIIGNEVWITI